MQQQTEAFVREVRNATKMQSDDLRRRLRYDYFTRDVDADLQVREMILNALDQTKGRIAPGGTPGITPARAPRPNFGPAAHSMEPRRARGDRGGSRAAKDL